MSGDWMKVQLDTPDKPEVQRIAGMLGIDPDAVVGKLIRVWAWFDKHTENGHADGVTYSLLDRITCHAGFSEAMAFVGWLHQDGHILSLPNFDRHNGKTAKNRALSSNRQAAKRANVTQEITQESRNERDKSVTREEKRREEEEEKKQQGAAAPIPRKRATPKTSLPDGFGISPTIRAWASENGITRLDERLQYFTGYALANGKTYADWDAAFRNSIRDDWAKLNGKLAPQTAERRPLTLQELGVI